MKPLSISAVPKAPSWFTSHALMLIFEGSDLISLHWVRSLTNMSKGPAWAIAYGSSQATFLLTHCPPAMCLCLGTFFTIGTWPRGERS